MEPAEQPTLADVAERAGVSVATASRALTGARPVSVDLQRKVREASRSLGYRRNTVASSLRLQRTETVGLVLPRYATSFLSALIESVSDGLEHNDMSLVLRYSEPDAVHDPENIESLLGRRVDGIIICPPSLEVSREAIDAAGAVPVVQVGRFVETDRSDSVGLDEDRATGMLISHLAERSVRSILVAGLDERAPADARRLRALQSAGAPSGITVSAAEFAGAVLEGGIRTAERLMAGTASLPDAVVCANDDVASGVLAVLRMRGVPVPDTVQVASLLDLSPGREDHSITTLRHPWPEMGRESVRLLIDSIGRGAERVARRVSLAPQLVPGSSTRP